LHVPLPEYRPELRTIEDARRYQENTAALQDVFERVKGEAERLGNRLRPKDNGGEDMNSRGGQVVVLGHPVDGPEGSGVADARVNFSPSDQIESFEERRADGKVFQYHRDFQGRQVFHLEEGGEVREVTLDPRTGTLAVYEPPPYVEQPSRGVASLDEAVARATRPDPLHAVYKKVANEALITAQLVDARDNLAGDAGHFISVNDPGRKGGARLHMAAGSLQAYAGFTYADKEVHYGDPHSNAHVEIRREPTTGRIVYFHEKVNSAWSDTSAEFRLEDSGDGNQSFMMRQGDDVTRGVVDLASGRYRVAPDAQAP